MLSPFAPVRPYAMRRKKVRPSWHLVTWLVLVVLTAGCATFRCRPTTIVVAKKDENVRLETRPGLPRTTANDRVEEEVAPRLVREYWVQSDRGEWYRISEAQYRSTDIGQAIEMCL